MRIASQPDDLAHRQRFDRDALGQHDAKTTSELGVRDRAKIGAAKLHAAPERRLHPGDRAQQRRLADPVRTEQADELAGVDCEVDVLEHGAARSSRTVADGQIARAERGIEARVIPQTLHAGCAAGRDDDRRAHERGHRIERQHAGIARQQRDDLRRQRDGAAHQHDRRHQHPMIRGAEQAPAEMRHGDAEKRDRPAERRDDGGQAPTRPTSSGAACA